MRARATGPEKGSLPRAAALSFSRASRSSYTAAAADHRFLLRCCRGERASLARRFFGCVREIMQAGCLERLNATEVYFLECVRAQRDEFVGFGLFLI